MMLVRGGVEEEFVTGLVGFVLFGVWEHCFVCLCGSLCKCLARLSLCVVWPCSGDVSRRLVGGSFRVFCGFRSLRDLTSVGHERDGPERRDVLACTMRKWYFWITNLLNALWSFFCCFLERVRLDSLLVYILLDGYQEASQDIDLICDPVMEGLVGKICTHFHHSVW